MINYNTFIVYDFETSSANPNTTQPIQLAAVAVHPQKLEIIPGSKFESLIRPIEDPTEQAKAGLGVIEDEALAVNKKTLEELREAPSLKVVWGQFIEYVNNYNYKKNSWSAPVRVGFNNIRFDDIIADRIAGPHGWGYGPWDKVRGECTLFNTFRKIDIMDLSFTWFNSTAEPKKLSQSAVLEHCGLSTENSHDALVDVKNCAELLCKFLKLHKNIGQRVNWSGK